MMARRQSINGVVVDDYEPIRVAAGIPAVGFAEQSEGFLRSCDVATEMGTGMGQESLSAVHLYLE